jgi:hypothetical protein
MNSWTSLLWLCGLLLVWSGFAHAQQENPNNLPPCPKNAKEKYHNCWGKYGGYVGEFQNDKFHGIGRESPARMAVLQSFPNGLDEGSWYYGEWKEGLSDGLGILSQAHGTRIEGVWKKGKFIRTEKVNFSQNISSRKTGDDGEQHFVDGQQTTHNPKGLPLCPRTPRHPQIDSLEIKKTWTKCWGSSGPYKGEWENGNFNGFGIYTFQNGDVYQGSFFNGRFHGLGTLRLNPDNHNLEAGHDGKYEGRQTIFYPGSINDTDMGVSWRSKNKDTAFGIWHLGRLEREFDNSNNSIQNGQNNFEQDRRKLAEERPRPEEDRRKSKQQRSQSLSLAVTNSQPNPEGIFNITIQTNADTASLLINGEEQGGRADGNYSIKRVARVGQDTQFTITAVDVYGNSDTKTITVTRQAAPVADTAIALKPEAIKRAPARDAVAIIIGIQDYKRVPKAEFANNDAKEFYEYAIRALGIKQEKIKMLLDDEADEVNIVKAFENWLPIQVNKDKTDVYVFYSGHGLPAPDGKSLYFLPHGVDKELLSRTAVGQNEIVAALSAAKPKSVTMFIDACYSGQTRSGDVLIANAKPLSLKSDTSAYPPNFTVITASANDQISSSSPELKHGIFSFYLMKGMEGEADANKDGRITVGEMQEYLSDKVSRQAMMQNRKQTTQLVGDAGRVLITR